MAYSKFVNGFQVTTRSAIDQRVILSKAEMLSISNGSTYLVPELYFALCTDDRRFYIYDASNSMDAETGKYRQVREEDIETIISRLTVAETSINTLTNDKQDKLAVTDGLIMSGSTLSINFDTVAKTADLNSLYKQVNVNDDQLCIVSQISNLASGVSSLSLNKVDKNGTDRLMTEDEATKLAGIEANANKFPSLDASVDGNYFLQATVSNGTITYSWAKITESEE